MRVLSLKIEALKPESPLSGSWLEVEFSGLMGPKAAGRRLRRQNAESVVRVWKERRCLLTAVLGR